MPLAGKMRLNTFLAGVAGLAGIAVAGAGALYVLSPSAPVVAVPPPPVVVAPVVTAPIAVAPDPYPEDDPNGPTATSPAANQREVDAIVLGYQGRDIGSDKLKDVTSGKSYKVNVYQDAGKTTANRAKIDLDRDDKWDEKITFEPDKITRQVAPGDDESYTLTFHWDGAGWAPAP